MTIKTVIIGPGKIAGSFGSLRDNRSKPAYTHAHAITSDPRYSLNAVVGVDPKNTITYADRWNIPGRYDDLSAMLTCEQPDLAVITSPDGTHTQIILSLLESVDAPKVIICEKPICLSKDDLEMIRRALDSAPKTTLLVNQSYRFSHSFNAVKELLQSGQLGAPVMARWIYYGGWVHNGVHFVDILPFVFGEKATLTSSKLGYLDRENDPCIDAKFNINGTPVHLESTPEYAFQVGEGEIRLMQGRVRMAEFCSDVYVDEPIQNDIGEIELKPKRKLDLPERPTPMEQLYSQCGDLLVSGENQIINLVGMHTIYETMEHLFNAIDLSRTTSE